MSDFKARLEQRLQQLVARVAGTRATGRRKNAKRSSLTREAADGIRLAGRIGS